MDAKKQVDIFFEKQKQASEIEGHINQIKAFFELTEHLEKAFIKFYNAGFKDGLKKIEVKNIN